jgi:SPASM domain peptide maturase of grasp-with-spasm system
MKNKLFKTFSDCIIVKGYSRSVIYDLTRKNYEFIPNSLFEILDRGVIDVNSCYASIKENDYHILDEYLLFLVDKEYIFEIENYEDALHFPSLDLNFEYPSKISNAIIDYSGDDELLKTILKSLGNLNCNFIVIRILCIVDLIDLRKLLDYFEGSVIFSIDVIMNYEKTITLKNLQEVIKDYARINVISVFESPIVLFNNTFVNNGMGNLFFTKSIYDRNLIPKIRDERNFAVNIKLFTEAIHFNTFYNKKIYISEEGAIKNSPYSTIIFGNVLHDDLSDVIDTGSFKSLWNMKKDYTLICKDCEFRYMCVDSRVPEAKVKSHWSFQHPCGYNPYEMKWNLDA